MVAIEHAAAGYGVTGGGRWLIGSTGHETIVTMNAHECLPPFPEPPLPVAISECLTGAEVRYDGAHQRSGMPHAVLDPLFEYRPICPEVGIGLGVPREVIRLVGPADAPSALQGSSGEDLTERLASYARDRLPQLEAVDGYIFMKNSPSCGLYGVKVFARAGQPPVAAGRGIFAARVTTARPDLPVEEGGRLFDAALAENFVIRTFVHAHWRRLITAGLTAQRLMAFHSAYQYLLMAHGKNAYPALGPPSRTIANEPAAARSYFESFMLRLARPATRHGHANALAHFAHLARRDIEGPARRELSDAIESFRRGQVGLRAPLALLARHLGRVDATYSIEQFYLHRHPATAALRQRF